MLFFLEKVKMNDHDGKVWNNEVIGLDLSEYTFLGMLQLATFTILDQSKFTLKKFIKRMTKKVKKKNQGKFKKA